MNWICSIIFTIAIVVFSPMASADLVFLKSEKSLKESFPKGSGGQYELSTVHGKSEVSLYISESSDQSLGIEMLFRINGHGPFAESMWQQFKLVRTPGDQIKLTDGYMIVDRNYGAEKMPPEHLNGEGVFRMEEFQMLSMEDLKKRKTKNETLQMDFGPLETSYTKMEKGGVTLEYWISEKVKPLGLVQIKSRGVKPSENYTMKFKALLKGVEAMIEPAKAKKELSKKGRKVLGLDKK